MTTWGGRPAWNFADYLTAEKMKAILDQIDLNSSAIAKLAADHAGVTSSTTFVNTNLRRPVKANTSYWFRAPLNYSASTTGDFKPGGSMPSGSTLHRYLLRSVTGGTDVSSGDTYFGTDTTFGVLSAGGQTTATAVMSAIMEGWFTTGGSDGEFIVQYAQANSHGTATILRAHSSLEVRAVEVV